ncbi:MAG: hypothetical protein HZB45_03380 [Mycolicibacterium rufum]|uniref:Transmembrane protein n=1 Tax=Mycolicibacterium chlorophenolicum TaxID=37916 RepID=A0A0J6VAG8_9MYCO|nr:hypothetical protein [Mycolicibacterium chlorophenolicum]KMO67905.1 hypothetical protein MCHLDSM_07162 [Mycolicibacterium chlorophenolicum]MBI5336710.1 hypothetical protein [Mycolicibacterium rufum]
MKSRWVPYATTPGRLLSQLFSDLVVIAWTAVWVFVGMAVHSAVATIAEFGYQVESGANGVAGNLDSAGRSADNVPLIGDSLANPLSAAGDAAREIAGAGQTLGVTAGWLAWLLALAVAAPPILALMMPWLFLRVRFFRRQWTAITLASTAAGEELLALRALANRPLAKLAAVSPDPVGAWRSQDRTAIRGLAALELRATGIRAANLRRAG